MYATKTYLKLTLLVTLCAAQPALGWELPITSQIDHPAWLKVTYSNGHQDVVVYPGQTILVDAGTRWVQKNGIAGVVATTPGNPAGNIDIKSYARPSNLHRAIEGREFRARIIAMPKGTRNYTIVGAR